MTDLIEAKTADLSGEALAWAVAKADGLEPRLEAPHYGNGWRVFCDTTFGNSKRYNPLEDWALGGPLIEKYEADFNWIRPATLQCVVSVGSVVGQSRAESHLVAACRAIINGKFGDATHIPKELMP